MAVGNVGFALTGATSLIDGGVGLYSNWRLAKSVVTPAPLNLGANPLVPGTIAGLPSGLARDVNAATSEIAGAAASEAGTYTGTIRWGIRNVNVRPAPPGFWGERFPLSDPAADAYELQINPNNESYYLPHPKGGYVQFEKLVGNTHQDGKLVVSPSSIYYPGDQQRPRPPTCKWSGWCRTSEPLPNSKLCFRASQSRSRSK